MDWIWYFFLSPIKQWSWTGVIIGMWCHFRNDGMTLMVFDIKTQFCYCVYKMINTSRTLSHLSKLVCWHKPFPIVQWRKTSLLALLGGLIKEIKKISLHIFTGRLKSHIAQCSLYTFLNSFMFEISLVGCPHISCHRKAILQIYEEIVKSLCWDLPKKIFINNK